MSKNAYERLAPFIQEYIYREKWQELRDIQIAACEVIFDTDLNLLLSSGTASGKTEAAFLPILTELYNNPPTSVGVLYISPLKALINDQFVRLDGLLEYSDIPVWKWHGDVSQNIKRKLINNPRGVMQTTPESLESMIMKRKADILTLFSDLKFIVIDEVHHFMSSPRGIQLLSIIERIQRLTKNIPRRIGLSATLGDSSCAENWLSSGTGRRCITPKINEPKRKLNLLVNYFPLHKDGEEIIGENEYFDCLYRVTDGKKCILFSNSKADVENNIAMLKTYNKSRHGRNKYMVHHGNISAVLREDTERKMKSNDFHAITGATVTLELGIDIGNLDRIVQTGSPFSVSSFVQRLGRSGRKSTISEMCFVFKEFESNNADALKRINWEFLKCLAIIQLYIEERWIEPQYTEQYPFSLLYHQTMSTMYSAAEMSPAELAQNILTLSAFKNILQEDFRLFLNYLINIEHLEITDRKTLLVGLKGEQVVNKYDFFSVFVTPIEYSVRHGSEEIGTVQKKFPKGETFALAGFAWKVVDIDTSSNCIYVERADGRSFNSWSSLFDVHLHTKIMKKIREILLNDIYYTYLTLNSTNLLKKCRFEAQNSGILSEPVVKIADASVAVFPWVGTKALKALYHYFTNLGYECSLYADPIPLCIIVRNEDINKVKEAYSKVKSESIDKYTFNINEEIILGGKFDDFVEPSLLLKEYIEDYLDTEDLQRNME